MPHDEEPPPYGDDEAPPGDNVTPITTHAQAPHLQSERALLGALLRHPERYLEAARIIDPGDFDEPRHQIIWDALTTVWERDAVPPDSALLLRELQRAGAFPKVASLLPTLTAANPNAAAAYARDVHEAAETRYLSNDVRAMLADVTNRGADNLNTTAMRVMDRLDNILKARHHGIEDIPTIDDLLAAEDDDYDWVVPGLLEHQERVIITAEEGAGKTTLLRQFAITCAAGIHPFTHQAITPIRVLHVDVENSTRQNRRLYRPMRIQAGTRLDPANLHVEVRVEGIDLTTSEDQDWLASRVRLTKPDLLLIGPIYKLANGDPTEEKSAKPVAMALDRIRADHQCAIVLEAHAAKAPAGSKKRPHEPYGWSGWLRWPEIGLWLDKEGDLTHWRGAREERDWPHTLVRGGRWPWTPSNTGPDLDWQLIRKARLNAKRSLSQNELAGATGLHRATIQRLIGKGARYADAWAAFNNTQHVGDEFE